MLQSMGSQRTRHSWVAEQQQRHFGLSQVLGVGEHVFSIQWVQVRNAAKPSVTHGVPPLHPTPLTTVSSSKDEKTCPGSAQASALCPPHSSQGDLHTPPLSPHNTSHNIFLVTFCFYLSFVDLAKKTAYFLRGEIMYYQHWCPQFVAKCQVHSKSFIN